MKVPTDNYRKKIVIFNNRILQKCNTNSESFHGYDITQSVPSVQNSHSSNFSEDGGEINIELENGEKIKFNFYLNKNIYNDVENFCKKNNISEEGQDLILEQIDSKIAELMKQNKANILKNNNNKIIESQKDIIIKQNKMTGDEIGQRLYEKGMKFKLKKEINISRMKTQLRPKYNFHPQLSLKTRELTKNLYNKKIKIEDRLILLGNEHEKKILKKIAEKKFLEENENTNISRSPSRSRSKSNNKKNDLKRIKSEEKYKKENLKEDFSFKPKITKLAKNMKKETYNNILQKYNNKLKLRREKSDQEIKNIKNANNIKKISTKINLANNKKPKNFINKNIKEINIIEKKRINNNLLTSENSKNISDEELNAQMKKNFDIKAQNILNKIKEYKFKEIFDLLDSNKQGYLSYSNIYFDNINKNVLVSLSPVISEINENKNKKIDFKEFKKLANKSLSEYLLK